MLDGGGTASPSLAAGAAPQIREEIPENILLGDDATIAESELGLGQLQKKLDQQLRDDLASYICLMNCCVS